jgi:DNA-binding MltR family transcriptional regulator
MDKLAEELKKTYGLNLSDVLRSTHPETVIRVATLVGEALELALRSKLLAEKKPVHDRMFKGDGPMATLAKRIDAAHDLNLIDDVTRKDAHLVRRIRNGFAHAKEQMHFDSAKTVAFVKQLSTYEAAPFNQEAFLKAAGNISAQAAKAARALREESAQAEPKSPEEHT